MSLFFSIAVWVLPPCNKPSMFPMLLGYIFARPPAFISIDAGHSSPE
jgi:hypothetical protein